MMKKRASDNNLIRMANQISEYFDFQTGKSAAEATAEHINGTWAPKMRSRLIDMINAGDEDIRPTVIAAESMIKRPRNIADRVYGGPLD